MDKINLGRLKYTIIAIAYSIAQITYKIISYKRSERPHPREFVGAFISATIINPFLIRLACLELVASSYTSKEKIIGAAVTMTLFNLLFLVAIIFSRFINNLHILFSIFAIIIDLGTSYLFFKNTKIPNKNYLYIPIASILSTIIVLVSLW